MTAYRLLLAAAVLVTTLLALTLPPYPQATAQARAPEPALRLPSLRAEYRAPALVLHGLVPSEAERAAIVRQAWAIYGAANVTDRLLVAQVAAPSWLDAGFLPDLRAALSATATLRDATLWLDGETPSLQAQHVLLAQAADYRARGLSVVHRLTVPEPRANP